MTFGSLAFTLVRKLFLKQKTYGLGNKIVGRCLLADVVWLLISAILNLPFWNIVWVIIPWAYFPKRYFCIKKKKEDILRYAGDERARKKLKYLDWLLSEDLMYWEIKVFLFDALGVLFEIGAIRQLKEELKKLDDFKNHYEYKRLLSYVYSVTHKQREMIPLLWEVLKDKNLDSDEKSRTINNLYHAYTVVGDKEGQDSVFRMLEDEFNNGRGRSFYIETLDSLFYRYEQEGERSRDKFGNLIRFIQNVRVNNFDKYIKLTDILYYYYKRNDKREDAIAILDCLGEKAQSMNLEEEDLLICILRSVRLYMDLDYRWKEITIDLFRVADSYLTYNRKVAFEYMEMALYALENADQQFGRYLDGLLCQRLLPHVLECVNRYIAEFNDIYVEEDERLLYLKHKYIHTLIVYYRLQSHLNKQYVLYGDNLERLSRQLVDLSRKNEESSMLLHSLMSSVDESITFEKCVNAAIQNGIQDPDIFKAQQKLPTYRISAKENLNELYSILKELNFDKACAYVILWTSYFMNYYGDRQTSKFLLDKFEQHNVSVKNYTLAVQNMYKELEKSFKDNKQ